MVRRGRGHELHLLTGAYAVDALTGAELAKFEKHLDQCCSCAEEVRSLRETAARIAAALAITPPPRIRAHVLAASVRTRQLSPVVSSRPVRGMPRLTRRAVFTRPVALATLAGMAATVAALAVFQVSTG